MVIALDNILITPKNNPTGNNNANGTVYEQAPLTKQ